MFDTTNYRKPHAFDPVHNGADECECGLTSDAGIHVTTNKPQPIGAPERVTLWICCHCQTPRMIGLSVCERCGKKLHDVIEYARSPATAAPVVDEPQIYADGFCARCSELAYPLTRALEKTGVPTGADNWQQTYGPNKVRALADLETCLRRLLFALEEGKPEDIKERITRANHYIEFHAEVRRRLTALAQERNADTAAATAAPQRAKCVNCAESIVHNGDEWDHEFPYRPECVTAAPQPQHEDPLKWLGYAKTELEAHASWWYGMPEPHCRARAEQALNMVNDLEKVISGHTASPVDHAAIPLLGYERVITIEWDKHNARRHELIESGRTRLLSEDEAVELHELQWLAGIKRELLTGPNNPAAPRGTVVKIARASHPRR